MRNENEQLETTVDVKMDKKQMSTDKRISTKKKIVRLSIIILTIVLVCIAVYLALYSTGIITKWSDIEKIKEIILKGGNWSLLIFFIIQFLQVTFIPLPAMITTVAGVLIFGPWLTFAISTIAIMIGSLFAFWLGRVIGDPVINWSVGKEEAKVWKDKLGQGKYVFFLMMLFPVFPDDMLCMVAGVTSMTYRFFIWTQLITRPITTFSMCFISSGELIPFSGWGIPVWILLLLGCAVLFFFAIKYQAKIENWILKVGKKLSSKKEKENKE